MSRVLMAVGQEARVPYRIEKIERNAYSAEELCYLLAQSAQILDAGIMDPKLVDWIRDDLGLPELADELEPLLGKGRALSEFISAILDYVGFVPKEREEKARRIVIEASRENARNGQGGMEPFNRRMTRAEYLEKNAQPYEALAEYETLLRELPAPEKPLRTKALCAQGRICAGLFRFRQAEEYYKKAYDCSGNSEVYMKYLAAVRMELSDAEYLAFLSEHPEAYNASLELESRMKKLDSEYEASEDKASIDLLRRYRDNHQDASYEIALHQTVGRLKRDCRQREVPTV